MDELRHDCIAEIDRLREEVAQYVDTDDLLAVWQSLLDQRAEIDRLKSEADRLQKLAEDLSGIICDANTTENQLRAELASAQQFLRECIVWTPDGHGHTLGCNCNAQECQRRIAASEAKDG